jgi:hypothetical protein
MQVSDTAGGPFSSSTMLKVVATVKVYAQVRVQSLDAMFQRSG